MVPGPVIHTRQRQAHYHAEQYLSYDRDVFCGTLYVTVPITWLRISSTRSESYQPQVLVAFPQVLLEPLEPALSALPVRIEPLEPALPGQVVLPADVAHVHLEQMVVVGFPAVLQLPHGV